MTKKWEKVLYKRQSFPDNYVDASFLSDLRKNVNLYKYSEKEVFTGLLVVTHEVSCTVLFVVSFIYLKEAAHSISAVLLSIALLLLFWVLQLTGNQWCVPKKSSIFEHVKSGGIFLTFGYLFSPILKTLTQSISTDTIYVMVVLMMITHVLLQDYGAAIVSSSLALNSALFAAVCLASRLPTVQHTFALVLLAVEIFVLLPLLRRKENITGLFIMTGLTILFVSIALIQLSMVYAVLFIILCLFINVLFPALFVYCQRYKDNIFGPWDEAVVVKPQ